MNLNVQFGDSLEQFDFVRAEEVDTVLPTFQARSGIFKFKRAPLIPPTPAGSQEAPRKQSGGFGCIQEAFAGL